MSEDGEEADLAWTTSFEANEKDKLHLYLTSVYFTITTITTVGYGDFSAHTLIEKIVCIFIMLTGVIGFASASGAITNYIEQMDRKSLI